MQKSERLSASESASELITGELPTNYSLITRQPLETAGFAARRVYHLHLEAGRNAIGSDKTSETMKRRYLLFRRKRGGVFYLEDTETRKQESLGTKNRTEALTLLAVRNESARQPQLNLQIARTYLSASDPEAIKRTWRVPLEEIAKTKKGPTRERWLRVQKDTAFELIRDVPLLETRPEHLLKVIEIGTVATNVFLRRIHNFAVDMGWLPWPVMPKKHWPSFKFREKRAITLDEHRAILAHEPNADRKAFYQLCWLIGASQSDVAFLAAENIDWSGRVISFARQKTKTVSMVHFGDEVAQVLQTLPTDGPLFPKLRKLNSGHRATEFQRVCRRARVEGVTLHCYRYAWAERAKQCGYPERFAQEALGHNSKAVHRAYSRKAKVKLPSLESYENQSHANGVILFPGAPLAVQSPPSPVVEQAR